MRFNSVGLPASCLAIFVFAGCKAEPAPGPLIIILADHYVSRDDFGADLRAQRADITDEEVNRQYETFLNDLKAVQSEQTAILRDLIREHGIRGVFKEGVTAANVERFHRRAAELAATRLADLQRRLDSDDFGQQALALVEIDAYERDLLQIGAAGRLVMENVCQVKPLVDEQLMQAANPANHGWRFDTPENDARERAMARRLVAAGPVTIAVVGQFHDLRAEIAAECPSCRVEVFMPLEIDRMNSIGK